MIHILGVYKKYITFLLWSYYFQIWPYVSPWIDLVQMVETFVWVAYNTDDPFGVIMLSAVLFKTLGNME